MILTRRSLYLSLCILGLYFFSLSNEVYAGINPAGFGCCNIPGDTCIVCEVGDCAVRGEECIALGAQNLFEGSICDANMVSCTDNFQGNGCCVLREGLCREDQSFNACDEDTGMAWYLGLECSEVPDCEPIERNVPTLSVWGVIALAAALGFIGFVVVRGRKATA